MYIKTLKNALLLLTITFTITLKSQTNSNATAIFNGVTMSGDWFLANSNTKTEGEDWENKFIVKRSYFTLKKDINSVFSVRYTQDIAIDKEGEDSGNVETRMKYLYLKIKPKWNGKITSPYIEVGMVHRPWITYEQTVNHYRVQGNMAVERNGLYNSAGFGILFGGNIGPKMDAEYLKNVNNTMNGKYASFAIGLYNGGGYAAFEENTNKVVEGIITVRPFPNSIPQIQISHAFNIGKGNTADAPTFNQYLFYGGYIGKYFDLTGQYHFGEGDFEGDYVMSENPSKSLKNHGFSFFSEYIFKNTPFSVFARYDYFKIPDDESSNTKREIGGIKYNLYNGINLVLAGEKVIYETKNNEYTVDLNLQVSF